jgi:HD-GYP domain-containing protein (c-di-GMP phosphodiesterase class II)
VASPLEHSEGASDRRASPSGAASSRGRPFVSGPLHGPEPQWPRISGAAPPKERLRGQSSRSSVGHFDVPVSGSAQEQALAYQRLQAAYEQALSYARDLREVYRRLERASLQALLGLANALEAKDRYTRGHSERVGHWARRTAQVLRLSAETAGLIAQAGLLHDIGKIGVPEAVLGKRGPLSEEEWQLMRRHPLVGSQIVAPFDFFAEGALMIRHHHERCDGTGYPDGLKGDRIPLGARIIAVVDVYDALTSDRPYRQALEPMTVCAELIQQAGQTLDAEAVEAFLVALRSAPRS